MTYTVTITSQGQLNIPADIRRKLKMGKTALLTEQEGKLIIEPVKDLLDLRGSIKTNKQPVSIEDIHDLLATEIAKTQ